MKRMEGNSRECESLERIQERGRERESEENGREFRKSPKRMPELGRMINLPGPLIVGKHACHSGAIVPAIVSGAGHRRRSQAAGSCPSNGRVWHNVAQVSNLEVLTWRGFKATK